MTISKRTLLVIASALVLWSGMDRSSPAGEKNNRTLAFGAIADCQYCAAEGRGARKFSLSPEKLTACVADFNTRDLAFVIHLGDFIDRDFASFDVVGPIYNRLKMPKYHVLGNHDFSVADDRKKDVPEKMGLTNKYYDFGVNGWRFVGLDGNDISFHAYPKDSAAYAEAAEYYKANQIKAPRYNGAVGPAQLSWLRGVLEKASREDEKVILFCHFPVYPQNSHNLWNAEEVVSLLEEFPCVKAYINGHNHKGNYAVKEGIHYLTLKAMVDTEETSYAVINLKESTVEVTGFGREMSRELAFEDNSEQE